MHFPDKLAGRDRMLTRDTIALAFYEYAVTLDDEYTYFWLHRTSTKTTWVVLLARYATLISVTLQLFLTTSQVRRTPYSILSYQACSNCGLIFAEVLIFYVYPRRDY